MPLGRTPEQKAAREAELQRRRDEHAFKQFDHCGRTRYPGGPFRYSSER